MARILVIDDVRQIRTYLRLLLEEAGHHVIELANGAQGLGSYEDWAADLIFCDLFMPVKDGLATIRGLREKWSGVKIIAMSGGNPRTGKNLLPEAAKLGACLTLAKPFTREQVLQSVAQVLEQSLDQNEIPSNG